MDPSFFLNFILLLGFLGSSLLLFIGSTPFGNLWVVGIVVSLILAFCCYGFAFLRRRILCGETTVCWYKYEVVLGFFIIIGLTAAALSFNSTMIDGTHNSGDYAVSAAKDMIEVTNEVYDQSLSVPSLDQETLDLIQDTVDYSHTFLDDTKDFQDQTDVITIWRAVIVSLILSFLIIVCLIGLWAVWKESVPLVRILKKTLFCFVAVLCLVLTVTTVNLVATSDFCWELDESYKWPNFVEGAYKGHFMNCNDKDYPFPPLSSALEESRSELVDIICQGWNDYCEKYDEVVCDTNHFTCEDQLKGSIRIHNRTAILEDGNTYTIDECSQYCEDDDLQSDLNTLNENLVGLDALNEMIIEIEPYVKCNWWHDLLEQIFYSTCDDALMGELLSLTMMLLIPLMLMTAGCSSKAIKRFDGRNQKEKGNGSVPWNKNDEEELYELENSPLLDQGGCP